MPAWTRVSPGNECPVCGHNSWCSVGEKLVCCMRVMSDRPAGDHGWHHPRDPNHQCEVRARAPEPKLSIEELTQHAVRCYQHERSAAVRESLAVELGVSVASLDALRVGFGIDAGTGREFSSWPARDWGGRIVGIVRRYSDGEKRSWKGGSTGLFYARGWSRLRGPILITEGGSDAAAAITAGLSVLSRPSNLGGGGCIARMCRARGSSRPLIVIGEHDAKPERRGEHADCPVDCKGCGRCWPGLFGAQRVARQLGCKYVMPPEGCKDFRDAYRKGMVWTEILKAL